MSRFEAIYNEAVALKGGEAALEALLPQPKSARDLTQLANDRVLSTMTQVVFQAGFAWRVIQNKWSGFEEAFHGFQVGLLAAMPLEAFAAFKEDKRIVRNWQKIQTVQHNARFVEEISNEYGSFGAMLAQWPEDDTVGLWQLLKKRGKRLGGNSGPYCLRMLGKDTFLLSRDVVTVLEQQHIVSGVPTSQRDLKKVQEFFNSLREESGRPLSQISRIISCTVPPR
jgi:3-methyladenine DNA glycosylase Tag